MSAINDLSPLGIKKEELNLLKKYRIKMDCGPLVYQTIIDWGFTLPKDKKIKDHINDLKIITKIKEKCNVNHQKWMDKNDSKIDKKSFSDFDITALHDFLPILCYEKVSQISSQEYEKQIKDPNSVESLLKEIKTFRNDMSHEYSVATEECHIDKMTVTMRECIRAAGRLYGKDQTEIESKVKVLDDGFKKVLIDTTHLYENRVKYIGKYIETEVPAILLERYSSYFSVPPTVNWTKTHTSYIFQCCNISATNENKNGNAEGTKNINPCIKIDNKTHSKFLIIIGGTGSGKTHLMRNIFLDILQTSVYGSAPEYEKLVKFKIPIYLDSRNEQQTDLATFLRKYLRNFVSPEDDILDAFKIVEGSVFLIDGYHEINNKCQKLLYSIIDFCRDSNASCIVFSRVDAGNDLINKLQERNLSCTKTFIEPISEMSDKVSCLKSYADNTNASIDTHELLNSFVNLTAAVQEVFSSPVLLRLFFSLFVNDPDSVFQMKNEQSAFKAFRTNFLREMASKLENIPNPKDRAIDVFNVLGKFCLKFFRANEYHIDEEEYLKIVAECEKIRGIPEDINIPCLLSSIITPEYSLQFCNYISYQFIHSTIQECFAAKYVIEKFRELQDDRNSQNQSEDRQLSQLLQVLELDESQADIDEEVKRYGNIIKLLMLETSAYGELSKYSKTFTQLLKKYFEPEDYSPAYHLDLILSSDSNADIISIVSESMRGWEGYKLEYNRHIKPMTEVIQTLHNIVKIDFNSHEFINTQHIITLLSVLRDGSEIWLGFRHSYENYEPLEDEFYTQIEYCRCKIRGFFACISYGEHLSIMVKALLSGSFLAISIPLILDMSIGALERHIGELILWVKYPEDCPHTGSNPVKEGTFLTIDYIPADGKVNLYKAIKYMCPKSKQFGGILLSHCHLTDIDVNELMRKLQRWNIRTVKGGITKVWEEGVYEDKSRDLELSLKGSEKEETEEEETEEGRREGERREEERREMAWIEAAWIEEEEREEERRENLRSEEERREEEEREEERREEEMREEEMREEEMREEERREEERREEERRELELIDAAWIEEERREEERREEERKEEERREEERRELAWIEEEESEEERREEEEREEEEREEEEIEFGDNGGGNCTIS